MSKLKIGLLVDAAHTDKYVRELASWASARSDMEISAIVVCAPPASGWFAGGLAAGGWRLASRLFFAMVLILESLLLQFFKGHGGHRQRRELAPAGPRAIPRIQALYADQRFGLAAADVSRAAAFGLDLLVQVGARPLGASLRNTARLGTVTLDYHGRRASRAAPPGFWEAYGKAPKTEFDITHQGSGAEQARILVSGSFPTKFFFLLNQAHLFGKAAAQLKGVLQTVAGSGQLPAPQHARPYSGRHFGAPGAHQSAAYLCKVAARLAAKAFYRIFHFQQKWGISCIRSDWKNAALWNSTRIAAPRGHFWADPFVCTHEGRTYCFVEDYVYKTARGHISVFEITADGPVPLGDCIREDFHMSFPFLFRYKGELYMCPEASASREIRIYRCTSFPLGWQLCAVPMDNVSAADSMFFEHGGKWWLLTNLDRAGLNDHCSELCLFSAESPFQRHWTPHPQNPLRIDSDGGRNAGLILEDGRIFRAAQRQGFDQYGKGLALYEITTLDDEVYVERLVSQIDCGYRRGLLGSHHMSTTGDITVFDHVGRRFFP